jgi:hypothetical protein
MTDKSGHARTHQFSSNSGAPWKPWAMNEEESSVDRVQRRDGYRDEVSVVRLLKDAPDRPRYSAERVVAVERFNTR